MTEKLDPKDFIITRKRKKYKFALFFNSPICFEYDEWDKSFVPDFVEVGAGDGKFSVQLAALYPDRKFVALDVKADRLQSGARLANELGLVNIRFVRARADQIDDLFQARSLTGVWVTFPDPFPRQRSSARRLTHPAYLKKYRKLLKNDGSLGIKHDDVDFFCWSLEQLVDNGWRINELSFDLHESSISSESKTLTTYEKRWLKENLRTNFVRASC